MIILDVGYNLLILLCFVGMLVSGCAPQRAEFTRPAPKKSAESQLRHLVTANGLEIRIRPEHLTALKALVTQLEANSKTVAPGDYRLLRHKSTVTKAIETRKQLILSVTGNLADYETRNTATGELVASGKLAVNDLLPVRTAVKALSEERYDEMFNIVAGLLVLRFGSEAIPQDAKVSLEIRNAGYYAEQGLFKLFIVTTITLTQSNRPTKIPSMALDLRFAPDRPKPFDIVYIAYGQRVANQAMLETTGFGPQP